jgi:hypothetical protein
LYANANPTNRSDVSGLWSGADAKLFSHFYFGGSEYCDISNWCQDYLGDPQVQIVRSTIKNNIRLKANSSDHFLLSGTNHIYISPSSIFSFGEGGYHFFSAECHVVSNDGCCKKFECKINYAAWDKFEDLDDSGNNYGGTPFSFGLLCAENFKFKKCD